MSDSIYLVKNSGIHGKGLFATRTIKRGAVIGKIKYNPVYEDGPYVLWINENTGVRVDCDLKYINHHAKPNACYFDDLEVVALKDIHEGEEITHNYGEDWK